MAAVLKTAMAGDSHRGFESHALRPVISQDIGDTLNPRQVLGSGFLSFLGLVVAAGVEGELGEQSAGGGGDDADVEVLDEDENVGSGVGSSDADVVESAVVPEGDDAGVVDGGRVGR